MIQIYTGLGKGKTTAALGLALRALGAHQRVCLIQFMKKGNTSEIKALKKFKNIEIKQFGARPNVFVNLKRPKAADINAARKGLAYAEKAIKSGNFPLIILDEINVAIKFKLIKLEEIIRLIKARPLSTELVLTGRYAHDRLIKNADLVTEMKVIKHYFDRGVRSRKGIEY